MFILRALTILILGCGAKSIDDIMHCLGNNIQFELVEGRFKYYQSDYNNQKFKSVFASNKLKIRYLTSSDALPDTLFYEERAIIIPKELKCDPLSAKLYNFSFKEKKYICLMSKSQSASGSGVQVSYYFLMSLNEGQIQDASFFSSRFGVIENIGDYNHDGNLDFIKIMHDTNQSDYIAKLYLPNKPDNPLDTRKSILLEYLGNDDFYIKESIWFTEMECK